MNQGKEKRPSASKDTPGRERPAEAGRETTENAARDWAWRASQAFIAAACGACAERLEESAQALRKREAGR